MVEWVESYIRARPNALTEKNIQAEWHHTGLVPTNRYKHPLLQTDDSNASLTLQPAALSASTVEDILRNSAAFEEAILNALNLILSELAINNEINTSVRHKSPKVLA